MRLRASLSLAACLLLATSAAASNHTVLPDGMGDFPTIQAAIDAAQPGDTVSLGNGVFTGAGNHRLHVNGKAITIRSAAGDPDLCEIDCAGDGRSFFFAFGEGPGTLIEGITMRNGVVRYPDYGGGAIYIYQATPTIRNCAFENNYASAQTRDQGFGTGGAIYIDSAEPLIEECVFTGNIADYDGGAVRCAYFASPVINGCVFSDNEASGGGGGVSIDENSSPILSDCFFNGNSAQYAGAIEVDRLSSPEIYNCEFHENTAAGAGGALSIYYTSNPVLQGCLFAGNRATGGGAIYSGYFSEPTIRFCTFYGNEGTNLASSIYCYYYSTVTVENSILAGGASGGSVHCLDGGSIVLSCADVWGNTGGDWIGCIAGQLGSDGNFSEDPLFCDIAGGNFRVAETSPCAASNSPAGCGTIGLGEGCVNVGVDQAEGNAPRSLRLVGNAPNPFNPTTTIRYIVPEDGSEASVRLTIHDLSGRLVRTLVDEPRGAGEHREVWNGANDRGEPVASGIYFSRLLRGGESRTGRMVLVR
ncbi:MAG: hypothetical protein JW958_01835 [Candidatus Eisenbacteria bacterium]|nr:hypothetical protein [Candidatus Eisenbacteria bacterium]